MGMATSDDEEKIYRDHARKKHLKDIPKNPNTWDHRATEDERAYYIHDLEEWAANLPDDRAWENYGNR
jgi:hypothetical protein